MRAPRAQHLPKILAQQISECGDEVQLKLWLSEDLPAFAGHFEQLTLAPGVAQVDTAVQFARMFLALDAGVKRLERLKFTCPMVPQTPVHLSLKRRPNWIEFRYFGERQSGDIVEFSQGRLMLA